MTCDKKEQEQDVKNNAELKKKMQEDEMEDL